MTEQPNPAEGQLPDGEVPNPAPPQSPKSPKAAARQTYGRIGIAICVLLLASTFFASLIRVVVGLSFPSVGESPIFLLAAGTLPLYLFGFLPAYFILRPLPCAVMEKNRVRAGLVPFLFLLCFGVMVMGEIVSLNVLNLLERLLGHSLDFGLDSVISNVPLPVTVLFSVILAPILEELFFRKVLIDRLAPFGGFSAVLISAVLFGLFHGNFYQAFYAAGLGLIFGWIYLYSGGKIVYSVVLHMLFNLIGGVLIPALTEILGLGTGGFTADTVQSHPLVFLGYAFYLLLLLASFLTAYLFFTLSKRRIKASLDRYPSPLGGPAEHLEVLFLNPGMPFLLFLFLASFALSLL